MITGLFETHISVADLEASMKFYGGVLGLEFGALDAARRIAFYWIGGRGNAMLGLWEKETVIPQHFAFRAALEDVRHHAAAFLKARNLKPYNFLKDGSEEPMVFAWMPALAIYFKDPDENVLELIAMLPGEPDPDVGVISYEAWEARSAAVSSPPGHLPKSR